MTGGGENDVLRTVADVDDGVRVLSGWLRDTDSFTQTIARWLRSPVDYILKSQERLPVAPDDALALEVSPGSTAVHRQGLFYAALHGPPLVVACVGSVVIEQRLSWTARQALRAPEMPLGTVLSRYDMRRHTHSITPTSTVDSRGEQILRVRATLTVAGSLVATVDEIIYRRLLEHRSGTPRD